jgi:hypothetical protein
MSPDWAVFDTFKRPHESWSWRAIDEWTAPFERQLAAARGQMARLRDHWDVELADLGGDPTRWDWCAFRALRHDREEDWSDWLAQLLEDSEGGEFACALLAFDGAQEPSAYCHATVAREVPHEGHRADIIVSWNDGTYTHVEVKVGDRALEKTLATSRKMRAKHADLRCRADVILLLPSQLADWGLACRAVDGMAEQVRVLTWIEVARAIRRVLRHRRAESIRWRVWAHAFAGAIEQELLGLPASQSSRSWSQRLSVRTLQVAEQLLSTDGGVHA